MSGHSKWAQIKRQKAVVDAKKGKTFTRFSRAITLAARNGVADPARNASLRLAIDQALAANMPKDNINRAIEKAKASHAAGVVSLLEAYGPGGVALLIEIMTDNRNRTIAEIRHILDSHGGSLGITGSVLWQFERVQNNMKPKHVITPEAALAKRLAELIHALEEHDDILKITSNAA